MNGDHNPYKLTPKAVSSTAVTAPSQQQPSQGQQLQAVEPNEWKTLTKGTKVNYEKSDGKVASGYVNTTDGTILQLYNKDYKTGRYINWSVPFSNIKRLSIIAQPYVKQATSGPAQVVTSPYQEFQQKMQQIQSSPSPSLSQSPYAPTPAPAPVQSSMQMPMQMQMDSHISEQMIDRKINDIEARYNAKISALEQELKKTKTDLNEIVVFLSGLQVVLKSKGIVK